MIITMSQVLFSLLILKAWGKFADRYGNYQVLKITALLVPLYPILWLVSNNVVFLIFGPSLVGGIGWAGFNLAAGNFVYDSVKPQKRSLAISYFHLLNGIGIFLGAGLGGLLAKTINIAFMDILLFIFLISAFARLTVSLIGLPKIKEVRKTEMFDSSKAFKHLLYQTFQLQTPEVETHHLHSHKKHHHVRKRK